MSAAVLAAGAARARRAPGRGFSLVEVLVAALILAIALLALSSLFALGLKNNAISKEDTVMAALAQDKIEQIKRQSRDTLESLFVASCQGPCASACAPCSPLPSFCDATTCCASPCYPRACAAASYVVKNQESPIMDPNPIDEVKERLYVREWQLEKVNLGDPVGCVFKITVTVGSRNGLLAARPTSASSWTGAQPDEVVGKTNPRRVVFATYRK